MDPRLICADGGLSEAIIRWISKPTEGLPDSVSNIPVRYMDRRVFGELFAKWVFEQISRGIKSLPNHETVSAMESTKGIHVSCSSIFDSTFRRVIEIVSVFMQGWIFA